MTGKVPQHVRDAAHDAGRELLREARGSATTRDAVNAALEAVESHMEHYCDVIGLSGATAVPVYRFTQGEEQ